MQSKLHSGNSACCVEKEWKNSTTKEIKTARAPAKIILAVDRKQLKRDGTDLSFIKATITDADGTVVPGANDLIQFSLTGDGAIVGTDNGRQRAWKVLKRPSIVLSLGFAWQ